LDYKGGGNSKLDLNLFQVVQTQIMAAYSKTLPVGSVNQMNKLSLVGMQLPENI
jgi:hypothetical protein